MWRLTARRRTGETAHRVRRLTMGPLARTRKRAVGQVSLLRPPRAPPPTALQRYGRHTSCPAAARSTAARVNGTRK